MIFKKLSLILIKNKPMFQNSLLNLALILIIKKLFFRYSFFYNI